MKAKLRNTTGDGVFHYLKSENLYMNKYFTKRKKPFGFSFLCF